jgi:hypothetical protein
MTDKQSSYLHIFSLIYAIKREFKRVRDKLTDKQLKQLQIAVENLENLIECEIDIRIDEKVKSFQQGVKQ